MLTTTRFRLQPSKSQIPKLNEIFVVYNLPIPAATPLYLKENSGMTFSPKVHAISREISLLPIPNFKRPFPIRIVNLVFAPKSR
jgi:hypothetical protein